VLPDKTPCDDVFEKIRASLAHRKVRMVDMIKLLSHAGASKDVKRKDLLQGLKQFGAKLQDDEAKLLLATLDPDRRGSISIQDFTEALRVAAKRAAANHLPRIPNAMAPEEPYDWNSRMLRLDAQDQSSPRREIRRGSYVGENLIGGLEISKEVVKPKPDGWQQASLGPWHVALGARVGCGSLHDNSITRQRLVDQTWVPKAPLAQRLVDRRWGPEPTTGFHQGLTRKKWTCVGAQRLPPLGEDDEFTGKKIFTESPVPAMQSEMDSIIWGRDLDGSGAEKRKIEYTKFNGCYGIPSWKSYHPDLVKGIEL